MKQHTKNILLILLAGLGAISVGLSVEIIGILLGIFVGLSLTMALIIALKTIEPKCEKIYNNND